MKANILIADNDPNILEVLTMYLTDHGYSVSFATDGKKGIDLFKTGAFDVVISDIRMPVMDGMEFIRQIREINDDVEIIVLTAFPSIDIAVHALKEFRAFDYIVKPINYIQRLPVTVDKALENGRMRKEKKALIEDLKQTNQMLKAKSKELEETNIALNVMIRKLESQQKTLEETMILNMSKLIMPEIGRLKNSGLTAVQKKYLNSIETTCRKIHEPVIPGKSVHYITRKLTPNEIIVLNHIKEGRTTKEIAALMNVSDRTVESYRNNLRKKFGLSRRKVNLRTYLLALSENDRERCLNHDSHD